MAKNVAQSTLERNAMASFDQRLAMAKRCSHEGVVAGVKAAAVATIATAIPTLASVRMLPWAKAHLNHTAQALFISTVAGAAYFIDQNRCQTVAILLLIKVGIDLGCTQCAKRMFTLVCCKPSSSVTEFLRLGCGNGSPTTVSGAIRSSKFESSTCCNSV